MNDLSFRNRIKPNYHQMCNPRRVDASLSFAEVTHEEVKAAFATISHIDGWRKEMAQLLYMSEAQVGRILNGVTKGNEARKDFIAQTKILLSLNS